MVVMEDNIPILGSKCENCGGLSERSCIEGHHERPGDDSSIVYLCKKCHMARHWYKADLPKQYYNINRQIESEVWHQTRLLAFKEGVKISVIIQRALINELKRAEALNEK